MNEIIYWHLKGTFRNQIAVASNEGLVGYYYCLFLHQSWPSPSVQGDFRLLIEENGNELTVMLGDNKRPIDSSAIYILILNQEVKASEEYLAVAATLREFTEEDGTNIVVVNVGHLVHVWNEKGMANRWTQLPSILCHSKETCVLLT